MARKRLNKKVALISSAVLALLILIAIFGILHLTQDPHKFLKDGDAGMKAANEATDQKIKIQEYERAGRSYNRARARAKDNSLKIEALFKLVDMYIQLDNYTETDQWRYVLGCWDAIIRIDPKNVKARFGRLKYFYIMADSGVQQVWQEIREQASEFIKEIENTNSFNETVTKQEEFRMPKLEAGEMPLGSWLYLIRGRAALEIARMGAVTEPDSLLAQAKEDLKKVQELNPDNVDAYWYLAQIEVAEGEIFASRGNLEQKERAAQQAQILLEQAIKIAKNNPKAYINLLSLKLMLAQQKGKEQIRTLESEYMSLASKFPSSADAFSAISRFYSDPRVGPKSLDKAIQAVEKAVQLDKENVMYAMNAATLFHRRYSYYGQESDIYKAIEIAKNALTLPEAWERSGPRNWANKLNRVSLYAFLARCYIDLLLEAPQTMESQTASLLRDTEQAVHEIEQILGSGEEPQVVKWRGMLELVKGNRELAARKLYAAYEQLKASARTDSQLSYTLAKIFMDSPEVGAVIEFLVSALQANITLTKPEAQLDYADILLKFNHWTVAISNIDAFEEIFGPNQRSQVLRIKAYIGAGQFDEAQEELAKLNPNDPKTIKLSLEMVEARIGQIQRAIIQKQKGEKPDVTIQEIISPDKKETPEIQASVQLMTKQQDDYRQQATKLVQKLLSIEPNSVGEYSIVGLCRDYIAAGQFNEAKGLVNQFLQHFPDNTSVLVYKHILSEPDPANVPLQRWKEIQQQVLSETADPTLRAFRLAVFYEGYNELDKAAEELKKVLKTASLYKPTFGQPQGIDLQLFAADHLLDAAIRTKDWVLAEQVVQTVQQENLDKCQGQAFAARLSLAKGNFNDALAKIDACLKQRPVFSRAYMIRSGAHAGLGNDNASLQDIQKAVSLNPMDGTIAKYLAIVLHRCYQKPGVNISPQQELEIRNALERAVILNPTDLDLMSLYADYVSLTDPVKALTILNGLQQLAPSVRNAIRLGQLSTKLASEETVPERKEALFTLAASAFEQAYKLDPSSREMLFSYAAYYRARGMDKEAEQLLQKAKDQELMWTYYFQKGQFEQAKEVLEQLYQNNPNDIDAVKGLLLVSEKIADPEAVKRYSDELLSLQNSVENQLFQIQTFLKIGLIKEAEYKLQSFKERYPDEPRAMLLEAWLVMRQGQLSKAIELVNRILRSDQNNAIAWQLRGQIHLLMANYNQAIADLKKSQSFSDEPQTRLSLAKAYLRMGREEDAVTELKSIIDSSSAPPVEAVMLFERIYLKLGKKEAIRKLYDDILKRFPDDVSWYNRAGAFAITENDSDRAEQLYKQAYDLKRQEYHDQVPQSSEDLDIEYVTAFDGYLQALILSAGSPNATGSPWNPQKLDTAVQECNRHIDDAFAPIAFYRMAEAKLKLGDESIAAEYCGKAVDKAGSNEALASEILIRMFLLLGSDEVSKYCTQKLAKDPNSIAANWAMFNLERISAQYDKAINYLDRCIDIAGPNTPKGVNLMAKKAETFTLAFEKTSDNNYLNQAIIVYESLLNKMPNNINVLNNLAYMLAEKNERLSDAIRYAKQAVDIRPNDPSFLDTYAYTLYKNGNFTQAAETATAALQQYEQSGILAPAEVYEHLGMIKEKLGAKQQALDYYKQALEVGANKLSKVLSERVKQAIERLSQ